MSEDGELVQNVLRGERGAFERLVRRYQGLVWHIVQRIVRDAEDTRELCQETFLRVHTQLHQFRGDSALKSWIGRIAYTTALRHLENRRSETAARVERTTPSNADDAPDLLDSVDDGFDLEAAYADTESAGHVRAAIATLPPLQRLLITLYHLDEVSIAEIATITGLAIGTIKSHLFRTRLQLRRVLENYIGVNA